MSPIPVISLSSGGLGGTYPGYGSKSEVGRATYGAAAGHGDGHD